MKTQREWTLHELFHGLTSILSSNVCLRGVCRGYDMCALCLPNPRDKPSPPQNDKDSTGPISCGATYAAQSHDSNCGYACGSQRQSFGGAGKGIAKTSWLPRLLPRLHKWMINKEHIFYFLRTFQHTARTQPRTTPSMPFRHAGRPHSCSCDRHFASGWYTAPFPFFPSGHKPPAPPFPFPGKRTWHEHVYADTAAFSKRKGPLFYP
jgi:hypothetical protein